MYHYIVRNSLKLWLSFVSVLIKQILSILNRSSREGQGSCRQEGNHQFSLFSAKDHYIFVKYKIGSRACASFWEILSLHEVQNFDTCGNLILQIWDTFFLFPHPTPLSKRHRVTYAGSQNKRFTVINSPEITHLYF